MSNNTLRDSPVLEKWNNPTLSQKKAIPYQLSLNSERNHLPMIAHDNSPPVKSSVGTVSENLLSYLTTIEKLDIKLSAFNP